MDSDPLLVPVRMRIEALHEDASSRTPPRPPRHHRPPGRLRLVVAHLLVRAARRLIGDAAPAPLPRS